MIIVATISFILMGVLNTIGVFRIGLIAKENDIKAKRKWLFIDLKDFKSKLESKDRVENLKELKVCLNLINAAKLFFLITILFFILSILITTG